MSWELLYAVLMIELKFLHVKLYICSYSYSKYILINKKIDAHKYLVPGTNVHVLGNSF